MKPLDYTTLKKFLGLAGNNLIGEWVLIGGTVLPLLGIQYRSTTDIDFIEITKNKKNQTLQLMRLTEKINLPIESVNQAGEYFLNKIKNFRKHLVLIHKGKNATIYRPDINLFIKLKINRLTESDLLDCLEFLKLSKKLNEKVLSKELLKLIEKILKKTESNEKYKRLCELSKNIKENF